jgi:Family of unknown function (DUF6282)
VGGTIILSGHEIGIGRAPANIRSSDVIRRRNESRRLAQRIGEPMKARIKSKLAFFGAVLLLAIGAFGWRADSSTAQSPRDTLATRFLSGAIDMHLHMDSPLPSGDHTEATIATIRLAKSRGLRGVVIKNHSEPTATLAFLLRQEIPNFEIFGGIVMNRTVGGMNAAAVEHLATQIYGGTGKVVWMPANDSEIESKPPYPEKPFVAVSRSGQLLPEVKEVIAVVAKDHLILASGHISPEDALLVFQEGRRQGVQHMIATHAMDLAGKMTMDQMLEAMKLGAVIEFDFRNILTEGARRADAIRKLGPEHCLISEFWTKNQAPREYAGLEGVGAFVEAMHARGFSDQELDIMSKGNPARLLDLDKP